MSFLLIMLPGNRLDDTCCSVLFVVADESETALPDFQLHYLYDGGSALAFCPMTPVFLTLLVLSKRGVNRVVLRVTAMVGVIIGCYNMGNFASETGFYVGLYHLPLLGMSIYALLHSRQKRKSPECV